MPDVNPVSTIQSSSPFHAVTMQEVHISTNLNDREIYKQGGGMVNGQWMDNYALTSVGLSKLMNAAGIEEVKSVRTDDRQNPYLCAWQFVAKWVQPDSTSLTCSEDYEIDLRDWVKLGDGQEVYSARFAEAVYSERAALVQKEFSSQLSSLKGEAKAAKTDQLFISLPQDKQAELTELAEAKALRSLVQVRKFVVQRAQTGAMLRAIRKMLNLKPSYSMQELKEPFRIPRSRYDWERMDAVLGKEVSSEMRQLQALQILGISPESYSKFRQLSPPKAEVHTPEPESVEAVFEEVKAEVVKSEPVTVSPGPSTKPETTTLADDEMDFLGKIVKKTAVIGEAATKDATIKNWIIQNIKGAEWGHEKHYLAHLEDHFGKKSAINLTYEQIWAMYLNKHKGVEYPFQWAGSSNKKAQKKSKSADPLTKKIETLQLSDVYARMRSKLGMGDAETDEKAAKVMAQVVDMVEKGIVAVSEVDDLMKFAKDALA